MAQLEWLAMTKREYENELEDADHLELLEIVVQKYQNIGESECDCHFPKNEKNQCTYNQFHQAIGAKLREIVQECHKFHGVKR